MNPLSVAFLLITLTTPAVALANCLNAAWIPFDAELYMPESESSIDTRAFEKQQLPFSVAASLAPQHFGVQQQHRYDPQNVRAFIDLPGHAIYIDRFGWIRQGNVYAKASYAQIEEKLSITCSAP